MRFQVSRSSDGNETVVELNTLEELLAWVQKAQDSVIITAPEQNISEEWSLEIYDEYRE